MDKLKGVAKGGWHPSGDASIHRDTWKSDLKGMATGRTPDKKHLESARNHTSAPLNSLKDPDSFGPPPKRGDASGTAPASSSAPQTPTSPVRPRPRAGLGGPVPAPRRRQEEQEAEEATKGPPLPYRTDTTGLKTDNLPKPPGRRDNAPVPPPPPRNSVPAAPVAPHRPQQQQHPLADGPGPALPPRMNDHPDEHTPPAPPPYQEATRAPQSQAPLLNQGALNRLGQAGVSVPGFNIGHGASEPTQAPSAPQGHTGQLSELQQRFARMNTGSNATSTTPVVSSLTAAAAAAAHKKPAPPPPPPKRAGLSDGSGSRPGTADGAPEPPPLPLSSKPRGT